MKRITRLSQAISRCYTNQADSTENNKCKYKCGSNRASVAWDRFWNVSEADRIACGCSKARKFKMMRERLAGVWSGFWNMMDDTAVWAKWIDRVGKIILAWIMLAAFVFIGWATHEAYVEFMLWLKPPKRYIAHDDYDYD
jgi:hypothetical protein